MKQDFTTDIREQLGDYQEPVPEDLWAEIEARVEATSGHAERTSNDGSTRVNHASQVRMWITGVAASVALFIGGWYAIDRMGNDKSLEAVMEDENVFSPQESLASRQNETDAQNNGDYKSPPTDYKSPPTETAAPKADTIDIRQDNPNRQQEHPEMAQETGITNPLQQITNPLQQITNPLQLEPNHSDRLQDGPDLQHANSGDYKSPPTGTQQVLPGSRHVGPVVRHRSSPFLALSLRSTNPMATDALGRNTVQSMLMSQPRMLTENRLGGSGARRVPMYLANYEEETNHRLPLTFGLSARIRLTSHWWIESGLSYTYLSSTFTHHLGSVTSVNEQRLHYVGIPLSVGYNVWQTGRLKTYVSGGTQGDVCVKSTMDSQTGKGAFNRDRMQFSFTLSAGVEYELLPHSSLYFQPGVSYFPDNGSRLQNIYKERPTIPSLQFGLRYSLR